MPANSAQHEYQRRRYANGDHKSRKQYTPPVHGPEAKDSRVLLNPGSGLAMTHPLEDRPIRRVSVLRQFARGETAQTLCHKFGAGM
jgi:hypothetical protein